MKNFNYLYDNLDLKPIPDEYYIKEEVGEYMKVTKNYKKQYSQNVKELQRPDGMMESRLDIPALLKDENHTPYGDQIEETKDEYDALWNCQR